MQPPDYRLITQSCAFSFGCSLVDWPWRRALHRGGSGLDGLPSDTDAAAAAAAGVRLQPHGVGPGGGGDFAVAARPSTRAAATTAAMTGASVTSSTVSVLRPVSVSHRSSSGADVVAALAAAKHGSGAGTPSQLSAPPSPIPVTIVADSRSRPPSNELHGAPRLDGTGVGGTTELSADVTDSTAPLDPWGQPIPDPATLQRIVEQAEE